jgi:hypothetical protein
VPKEEKMTEKKKEKVESVEETAEHEEKDRYGGRREEELTREFVKATEEFFTEIKEKYGGYEEVFRDVGIDIIKL